MSNELYQTDSAHKVGASQQEKTGASHPSSQWSQASDSCTVLDKHVFDKNVSDRNKQHADNWEAISCVALRATAA